METKSAASVRQFLITCLTVLPLSYSFPSDGRSIIHQTVKANQQPRFKFPPTWPAQTYYEADGPSITLNCYIVPDSSVKINWTKDGYPLPKHSNHFIVTNGNQSLTFTDPQKSDTGKYACVAWNGYGNISHERQVLVVGRMDEVPPVVVETTPASFPLEANVGAPVNISCMFSVGGSATALMDLRMVWLLNNKPLNDTDHTSWSIDAQEDTLNEILSLHIDSMKETDYGDYQCVGWNSVGNASRVLSISTPLHQSAGQLSRWIYIGVGVAGLVVCVVIAMTTLGCYRYRLSNKYETLDWEEPDITNYDVPNRDIQFDVFISYSSEDQAWVKDCLFANLTEHKYNVCVDFKDFTPGMAVSENIMDAVYKSRKTIVVISRNFLKSMWGQFELQQAHFRAISQRSDVLMLVKLDTCKVPVKLMGKTFLDWSNPDVRPHFWDRLYQSVGEPDVTANNDDVTANNDDVTTKENDVTTKENDVTPNEETTQHGLTSISDELVLENINHIGDRLKDEHFMRDLNTSKVDVNCNLNDQSDIDNAVVVKT